MRQFLNPKAKSFEIWSKDLEGPGAFSITERTQGKYHRVSFDVELCEKIILFLNNERDAGREVRLQESLRSKKSTMFLARGSNELGWFVKLTEWKKESKNFFIVISGDVDGIGWTNFAFVLRQMLDLKKKGC